MVVFRNRTSWLVLSLKCHSISVLIMMLIWHLQIKLVLKIGKNIFKYLKVRGIFVNLKTFQFFILNIRLEVFAAEITEWLEMYVDILTNIKPI